jgi:ankyrin repeat protein
VETLKIRDVFVGLSVGSFLVLMASLCYGGQDERPQAFKAIHEAAKKADLKEVTRLLEQGADVNAKDNTGITPLHWAVINSHKAVADLLIAKGADVSAKDNIGRTPLHIVANEDMAALLIAKNADLNAKDGIGQTPLVAACFNKHKDVIVLLILSGADVKAADNAGRTPLHLAHFFEGTQLAELLISKGANVNARSDDGRTPLYQAVARDRLSLAELLVVNGADINVRDKYGETPLHNAGVNTIAWLIAKGADVEAKNNDGRTPLILAAYNDRKDKAELLIANGANVNAEDNNGRTPLYWAGFMDYKEMTKFLTAKGAEINATDIHEAAANGNLKDVKTLLDKGIDVNAKDKNGMTPLIRALKNENKEMVELLIANGADVKVRDISGHTPLHLAALMGYKAVLELLMAKDADVNSKNNAGGTPLHSAAWLGRKDAAELLIAKGADLGAKDKDGATPLHYAKNKDIAELLIAKGADINAKNSQGNTPLHRAAEQGRNDVAELLIAKGADVNAKNEFGNTPMSKTNVYGGKLQLWSGINEGPAILAIAEFTGVYMRAKDNPGIMIWAASGGDAERIIPGTRISRKNYATAELSSGLHVLGVGYRIEGAGVTIAASASILKVPLTAEAGHVYVLASGQIDESTWAPVVVDLAREDLLTSLAGELKDPDPRKRVKAAIAAATALQAGVPSTWAASALAIPLSEVSEEPRCQQYAKQALRELGDLAVPFLLEKLKASDPKPRSQAARALGLLGADAKDALSSLMKVLENKSLRDTAVESLKDIVAAIAAAKNVKIEDAGLAGFIECLKEPSDEWTREFAAKILGDLGPGANAAIPALAEAQKSDKSKQVRNAADKALKKIRQ